MKQRTINIRWIFILMVAVFALPSWAKHDESQMEMNERDLSKGSFTLWAQGEDIDIFFGNENHARVFRDEKFHTIAFFDNARGSWCYRFYIEQWNKNHSGSHEESRIIDDIKVFITSNNGNEYSMGTIANTEAGEIKETINRSLGMLERGSTSGEYLLFVSETMMQEIGIKNFYLRFMYKAVRHGGILNSKDKEYEIKVIKSVDQGLKFTYTPMPTDAQFSVTSDGYLQMDVANVPGHSSLCHYSWYSRPSGRAMWGSIYILDLAQNGTGWDRNVDINKSITVVNTQQRFSPMSAHSIKYRGYMMGDKFEFTSPYADWVEDYHVIPAYLYPINLEVSEYDPVNNEVKISWQAQRTYTDVSDNKEYERSNKGKWYVYRERNGEKQVLTTLDGTSSDQDLLYTDRPLIHNVDYTYRVVFMPDNMQSNADAVLTWFESDLQPAVTRSVMLLSGTCGDNATWSLDKDDQGNYTRLTISGSGAVSNYSYITVDGLWRTTAPWEWGLTSITIGDEITSIGDYAFIGCQQLSELSLGNGVTSIGTNAFDHCDGLTEVNLPANVSTLAAGAFKNSVNLQRVNMQKSDGLVSITGGSAFDGCHSGLVIVTPTPALALQYKTASYWSNYATRLRVALGNQLFTATDGGGIAAYQIATATDLINLASAVNTSQGNISAGQTFCQTADIVLSGDFTPIGNDSGYEFAGTYYGGGHVISGLSISGNNTYNGLFGIVSGGTVSKVVLMSPSVSATGSYTGALIGKIDNQGSALNCYVYGTDNLIGSADNATVTNVVCTRKVTFNGDITATCDTTDKACGFVYQSANYYREGLDLILNGGRLGYDAHYSYTDGKTTTELKSDTLTVPAADITVSATYTVKKWSGKGTAEAPYSIEHAVQLNALADSVSSGISYDGIYFKLVADINYDTNGLADTESNFTAIGGYKHVFKGHFDGAKHAIRGIRIYKDGSSFADYYQGLFGLIGSGATVSNVFLSDACITGYQHVGGIVGNNSGGTVSNCYVLKNVTVNAVKSMSLYHGGIVGSNMENGIVTDCAGAAAVTCADGINYCQCYGGIVGENENATVKNCLYTGKTVKGASYVGAIIGNNCGSDSKVEHCYYTNNSITGIDSDGNELANANCAVGENSDKSPNPEYIGQVDYHGFAPQPFFAQMAPQDNEDNNTFIALMARRAAALKAAVPEYDAAVTLTLRGRTLNRDGKWHTVCLPFDVDLTNPDGVLYGAEARELTDASISGTTLNLAFSDPVEKLVAGTPYIIRLSNTESAARAESADASVLTDPTFTKVNIDDTDRSFDNTESGNQRVRFVGSYKMTNFDEAQKSILLMNGADSPRYPAIGTRMGAFRAYFMIGDGDSQGTVSINDFNIKLGDKDFTGIIDNKRETINNNGSSRKVILRNGVDAEAESSLSEWFDLNGRKLKGKPSRRSVYIQK